MEFLEEPHLYVVDGILVPSITAIIEHVHPARYRGIPSKILNRAAADGIKVHEAIEKLVKQGKTEDLPEVKGFKFLQNVIPFKVKDSEIPVILKKNGQPVAAGRMDLVVDLGGKLGGADIKRVAKLDHQYLEMQLNLYRLAYKDSYGEDLEFLAAIHLREHRRRWVDVPVNPGVAWSVLDRYLEMK